MRFRSRAGTFAELVVKASVALLLTTAAWSQTATVSTGTVNAMAPFDREIERFMQARKIPGGALAVVKDGRLVYARGYAWADRENRIPVSPDSLFRIASLSKPITAVAVLRLIEDGRLHLDDHPFVNLQFQPVLSSDEKPDPRLKNITIRHLLNHTAGWDSRKRRDPMFRSRIIARSVGVPPPASSEAIVRYMLGQPLEFDPGTRFAYSNFGYCVLGRVIEKVTSTTYEDYVKRNVLDPIGITDMRIGGSLKSKRAKNEVCYYTTNNRTTRNVVLDSPATVPEQYGGFCLEAMDAHGGWLASAVDLARFAAALDDPQHSPLLKPETFTILYARPDPPVGRKSDGSPADYYYACGWLVRPVGKGGKANYWHTGSLPGTWALLVRRWDRISWVVLFNQRSEDPKLPDTAIDRALHRAADAVKQWPSVDLFHNPKTGEDK
jgi:N-acyl-D-amino-acid deacylase